MITVTSSLCVHVIPDLNISIVVRINPDLNVSVVCVIPDLNFSIEPVSLQKAACFNTTRIYELLLQLSFYLTCEHVGAFISLID